MALDNKQESDEASPSANSDHEFSRSVLGVIGSGQWKSALFTTYTLSLTYVESHVLPALHRSGCETLTILADTSGYRDSLVEQRSRGVGRDYSVIPVRSTSGIFHPKLVYLEAKDGDDLLLVGSGNLTYPGHGGNIEVLEVIRASTAARAFIQCAEFFEELLRSEKVQIPDTGAVERAALRLRLVARDKQDDDKVQFIHSIFASGKQQLLKLANQIGGSWHELLVLSPYHHPKLKPVLELAESLGASKLLAGVPARKGEPSAFPFKEARWRFPSLRIVAPIAGSKPRNLHAKWFEVRGEAGTLVLTGSFNATISSFDSTDNVECGVLRQLAEPTTVWEDVEEPEYRVGDFPKREDAKRPCLFAVLAESNVLQGHLLGAASAGKWRLTLEFAEDVLLSSDVEIGPDGRFSLHLGSVDTSRLGTLQVVVMRDSVVARGWVQIAQVLRLEARNRRLMDAVFRSASGNETADDVQVLLDILAQEASRTIQATVVPRSNSGKPTHGGKVVEVTGVQFAGISANENSPNACRHESLLNALNAGAHGLGLLDALMAALLPRLGQKGAEEGGIERRPVTVDPFCKQNSGKDRAELDDPGVQAKVKKRERQVSLVYDALQKRLTELNCLLVRQPAASVALEKGKLRLLMVWLGTVLIHQVRELEDPDGALIFLGGTWMREVCSVHLERDDKDWVSRHVCGVAAAYSYELQWRAESNSAQATTTFRQDDVQQAMDPIRELRRRIFAFFGSNFSPDEVVAMAKLWLEDPRATALVAEQVDQAVNALRDVLSRPTEHQVLLNAVAGGVESQKSEIATYSERLAVLMRQAAEAARANPSTKASYVDVRTLSQCPTGRCDERYTEALRGGGRQLTSEIRWRLRKFGVYRCRCGQFLIARESV